MLNELWKLEDIVLGYRDVMFFNNYKGMLLLLGDMNLLSRVDAYLTNFKFPWEGNTNELTYSIGMLEVYKVDDIQKGKYSKT